MATLGMHHKRSAAGTDGDQATLDKPTKRLANEWPPNPESSRESTLRRQLAARRIPP